MSYQARVKRLEERFGFGGRPCPKTCLVCVVAADSGALALCDRKSFTIKTRRADSGKSPRRGRFSAASSRVNGVTDHPSLAA
jgi:hypothetical protein